MIIEIIYNILIMPELLEQLWIYVSSYSLQILVQIKWQQINEVYDSWQIS